MLVVHLIGIILPLEFKICNPNNIKIDLDNTEKQFDIKFKMQTTFWKF